MKTSDSLRRVVLDDDLDFLIEEFWELLETDLDRNADATELRKLFFWWFFPAVAAILAAIPVDCARPSMDVRSWRTWNSYIREGLKKLILPDNRTIHNHQIRLLNTKIWFNTFDSWRYNQTEKKTRQLIPATNKTFDWLISIWGFLVQSLNFRHTGSEIKQV